MSTFFKKKAKPKTSLTWRERHNMSASNNSDLPKQVTFWEKYERTGEIEARPYEPGEDLSDVSISDEDDPSEGDMIARNPDNHDDKWLIDEEYFDKNYTI